MSRHSGASRNPVRKAQTKSWIPAFAGMTTKRPAIANMQELTGLMGIEQEKAARALLDWYRAMGVDEAVGEVPFDSFAAPSQRRRRGGRLK